MRLLRQRINDCFEARRYWETEVKDDSRILLWYLEGQWCLGVEIQSSGGGPHIGGKVLTSDLGRLGVR